MTQNKNFIIAVIVILAVAGIGLAFYFLQYKKISEPEPEPEKNILTKEYFFIEIPEGWEETRGVPGVSAMLANLNEENTEPAVVKMGFKSYFAVAYEAAPGGTMDEFVQYAKDQLAAGGTGIEIVSEEPLTVNGREAYLMEGDLGQEGADFKAFIVIIKGEGDDMWFITFNTAADKWEGYKDLFDRTIQSFTLLGEKEERELQIEVLEEGEGEEAKEGDSLSVYYTGELEDGTQFDAKTEGEPFVFTLGAGEVIPGWDQGLVGMKVGEKRKLVIPPDLAYGEQGVPGAIPSNAVLIFTIELLVTE